MKFLLAITLSALATGCTAAADAPAELSARAQTRLSEALRGRVAGPAMSCVSLRELRGNRSIGEEAILFEGRGSVVYVNRPIGGCPDLSFDRALVTRTTTGQLCRGDIATVIDTTSRIESGSCGLGEFTPYRRVR